MIRVSPEEKNRKLEDILARSGLVFARGEVLVSPSRVRPEDKQRPWRSIGALHASVATEPLLAQIAEHTAYFVRPGKKAEDGSEWKKTDLADKYPKSLIARKSWPRMPELAGLAEHPILRPDGTVCTSSGYDERTGYVLRFSIAFPSLARAFMSTPAF